MSTPLAIVVGGAPAMAAALRASGAAVTVYEVSSTGGLRDVAAQLPTDPAASVFVFASNLEAAPGLDLDNLVGRLVGSGRGVVLLAVTPSAHDIVGRNRQAGVLTGPFTLNNMLGAVAGTGRAVVAVQDDAAFLTFDPVLGPAPAFGPAGTGHAPSATAWEAMAPDGSGSSSWQQAPAVTAPAAPLAAQAPARPSLADFASPAQAKSAVTADVPARSLAALASAASAGPTAPATSAASEAPDTTPAWSAAGGWGDATPTAGAAPAGAAELAPAPRGGMRVTHDQAVRRRGHVITITSPKGGTGKTSISINLAAYLGITLRGQGRTVCLVDANFGQADLGKAIDTYSPNIVDIARDPSVIHVDRIRQQLVHRPDLNLSILLGPASPRDANPVVITPKLYNQVLDVLKVLYDYILIDTQVAERFSSMHADFSIPRADTLLMPVTPNLATLMNADAYLRTICDAPNAGGQGFDERKVGILLNMAQDGVDCSEDDVIRELASWPYVGSLPLTPIWQKAQNNNELVVTYNYEELNRAFAAILWSATGEEALKLQTSAPIVAAPTSALGKFKGLLKKGGR
jgi:MinD-like ATPase involved in chromosome partitioning or flagellar assembly